MELRSDFFNIFNHPNFSNPLLPGFGIDVFGNSHTVGNRSGGGPLTRARTDHSI
jgi:hypothetical protein